MNDLVLDVTLCEGRTNFILFGTLLRNDPLFSFLFSYRLDPSALETIPWVHFGTRWFDPSPCNRSEVESVTPSSVLLTLLTSR